MAKPRVLISTDIGGMDNDDAQSLIHALLYADDMRYVGIVNTRTDDGGIVAGKPRDGMKIIEEIIDAYARDLSNLRAADSDYPAADALRDMVRMGAVDGRFSGQLSDGAKLMVSEARKASAADPLYILTWGPIHDAAAALLSAPDIVPNVRLISIAGLMQDKRNTVAYDLLKRAIGQDQKYEDLWWIDSEAAFKGFYLTEYGQSHGINATLPWVLENARGAGALGELLLSKYTYNVHTWMDAKSSPDGLKMGDSPSLLYLLDAVNNDNPAAGSWGGTFVKSGLGSQTWVDTKAPALKIGATDGAGAIARFRKDYLADYAERFDWAKGEGRPATPGPKPDPAPGPGDDVDGWASPNAQGVLRFGGKQIDGPTTTGVRDLDFGDGDRLVFTNYDSGTFRGEKGGNPLVVSPDGRYVAIDSVADLVELASTSAGVSARVDAAMDTLTLVVDKSGGDHQIVLQGYGRAFASGGSQTPARGTDGGGSVDVETWKAPDSKGILRFSGKQLDGSTTTGVRNLDLEDGDMLIFGNYDSGTFRGSPGGNRLIVTRDGKLVKIDAVDDLVEVVSASAAVSARVETANDTLVLEIDNARGDHLIALQGYGRAYLEALDL